MKTTLIAGLLLCVISLTAEASMWFVLVQQDDRDILVDTMSISKRGKLMKAWFRTDYKAAKKFDYYPFKEYQSQKSLEYFNCAERTNVSEQVLLYAGASGLGEVVGSSSTPVEKLEFNEVVPDSVGEAMLNYVCGQK